ncbi:unnamed protein product [Cunninghamella echinulata]
MWAPSFLHMLQPEYRVRYLHSDKSALRKCCGCIHLRAGAMISCLIWVGLSLYFAAVAFQHKSPFFSYLNDPPIVVFGVINLGFACISAFGMFTVFYNHWYYVSHVIVWVALGALGVIVDGIANVIIFAATKNDYYSWCISSSSGSLQNGVEQALNNNATNINFQSTDFYNCQRTWENELKFGILSIAMITIFYLYWVICFYSYSVKKSHNAFQPSAYRQALPNNIPMDPSIVHPMNPGGFGVYPNDQMMQMDANRQNVIVLSNVKPSNKSQEKEEVVTTPPPPYFSEFKKTKDENIIDIV